MLKIILIAIAILIIVCCILEYVTDDSTKSIFICIVIAFIFFSVYSIFCAWYSAWIVYSQDNVQQNYENNMLTEKGVGKVSDINILQEEDTYTVKYSSGELKNVEKDNIIIEKTDNENSYLYTYRIKYSKLEKILNSCFGFEKDIEQYRLCLGKDYQQQQQKIKRK